jgi:hypothetical protein
MPHAPALFRALVALAAVGAAAFSPSYASAASYTATAPLRVSTCSGQNAEVEQATDPANGYIYEEWMAAGCNGIAFSSSHDGGKTWSAPTRVPGATGSTVNSWDPDVVVGPGGTVYAAYMTSNGSQWYPVVATSTDHGQSFAYATSLFPPDAKNWGDRDFLATDPSHPGTVYLTYDYGPNRTSVTFACASNGSCGFSTGDVNVVMQKSTDYGKTWGPMTHVSPGFPASGADSGPIFVEPATSALPKGRIDVLFQDYPITDPTSYAMGPGVEDFTSSTDGGVTWSAPVQVSSSAKGLTMSVDEWWIDGALAVDSAGNLYASWDTQQGFQFGLNTPDTGWLSVSTDHGATWSTPIDVTHDTAAAAPNIMEVTPGSRGSVYVSWLSTASPFTGGLTAGYAQYLQRYAINGGSLTATSPIIQVSAGIYGDPNTWPGDTTGLSTTTSLNQVALSWGSGVPSNNNQFKSEIFSSIVSFSGS